MKKNSLYAIAGIIAMAAIITLNSCKKKADGIVGTWKVTSATFTPPVTIGGTTYTDAYPLLFSQTCQQDNLFIFKDGNIVLEDEGATKCDAADPQQTSATYLFSGTNLTIYSNDTTTFSGVSVDEDHLKGIITGDFGGGTMANVAITWSRQ